MFITDDIEKVRSYGVQKSPSNLICGVLSPNGSLFSCHFVPVRRRSSLVSTSQSPFASWQERELFLYLDRKSTRLNSSHVAISYAVFCLKTKTPTSRSS